MICVTHVILANGNSETFRDSSVSFDNGDLIVQSADGVYGFARGQWISFQNIRNMSQNYFEGGFEDDGV